MIQFSLPTAFGIFAASSAVAVTSVAVAVPILNTEAPQATPTVTATATPTPTSTAVAGGSTGGSPLSAFGNHDIGNGVMIQDLPMGLSAIQKPSGVTFSYVGTCSGSGPGSGAAVTIWGNNGQKKSWGSPSWCNGGITFAAYSLVWNEDTRNSYCYSPLGGSSAYRAEVLGQFTEWISIPDEYKQCINGQAPEGPLPPGEVAPVTPVAPAPSPSDSVASTPDPSVSPTP